MATYTTTTAVLAKEHTNAVSYFASVYEALSCIIDSNLYVSQCYASISVITSHFTYYSRWLVLNLRDLP